VRDNVIGAATGALGVTHNTRLRAPAGAQSVKRNSSGVGGGDRVGPTLRKESGGNHLDPSARTTK
jgi:hypothetical protein